MPELYPVHESHDAGAGSAETVICVTCFACSCHSKGKLAEPCRPVALTPRPEKKR